MESKFKKKYTRFLALLAVGLIAAVGAAQAGDWRNINDRLAEPGAFLRAVCATNAADSH